MKYDTVVGLEVHIQLNTLSKAFCGDANQFGDDPNTHVSPVSLAHPGTLPVVNVKQIEKAIQLGLSLGCRINKLNYFDRKHYFYPDLPKGYQITQDSQPICIGGRLPITIDGVDKQISIHHIHMEEDAGKTVHNLHDKYSMVDLNRAGTPLLELVTEPDLTSGEEVFQFITELQKLLRFIEVSDADMEKGSMRCDCNVSVKPAGSTVLGERCEIKNLNSKKFAKEAVAYEAKRQIALLERGVSFTKQTLHYNADKKKTMVLRDKEGAQDYRYFNDPDLPPIQVAQEQIDRLKANLPTLPRVLKKELVENDGFHPDYADQLTQSPAVFAAYELLSDKAGDKALAANFLINHLLPQFSGPVPVTTDWPIPLQSILDFLNLLKSDKVSASTAYQQLWPAMLENPQTKPIVLAKDLGILLQENQSFLDDLIEESITKNPAQVAKFKKGKKSLLGFFIGDVMKKSRGSANPQILKEKLLNRLS